MDFLVNPDQFRCGLASLESKSRLVEKAVLSRPSPWRALGLVTYLRVWATDAARSIVALVNQDSSVFQYLIFVGCATPHTHQQHACAVLQAKIHSPLKARRFLRAHLSMGNNVAWTNHPSVIFMGMQGGVKPPHSTRAGLWESCAWKAGEAVGTSVHPVDAFALGVEGGRFPTAGAWFVHWPIHRGICRRLQRFGRFSTVFHRRYYY